ncbi:MAG: O-antigen ligase family protein [Planctomycetota bacterium]
MPAPAPASSQPPASADNISVYERVLFFVLLGVLCARPMIPESFERFEFSFLTSLGASGGTTPATTTWLDSLTLTAAVAVLARRVGHIRGGGWLQAGVALLAIAIGISVVFAGDQRLALNAGFSLLIAVLAGAALVQLMRAPWMPRLLLAAMLASSVASATKCITQKAYEYDDMLQQWEESRAQLAAAGTDLETPTLINFERRLRSAEAIGYQSHPNITGSYLMMSLLVATGLLAGWLFGRVQQPAAERVAAAVLAGAVCVVLGIGLWFTHSTGALAAFAIGLVLLVGGGILRNRIAPRAGRITLLLVVGYGVIVLGAAGYRISRDAFPHASLEFRWYYWTAALSAFQDHPLTGVGRLNFNDAYLLHKPAESTEQVRDPHNIWVALLVELGPLGLASGVLLLLGCVWGALRQLGNPNVNRGPPRAITIGQMIAATAMTLLIHAVFWGELVNAATVLLWAVSLVSVWILTLALVVRVLEQLPATGGHWLSAGLVAALLAALIHGLIDFALLTPGGQSIFVVITVCAFTLRRASTLSATRPARLVPALLGMVLVSGHLILVTIPTMRTTFWLEQIKTSPFNQDDPQACRAIMSWGHNALQADPIDAATAREIAGRALAMGLNARLPDDFQLEMLEQAEDLGMLARQRNPRTYAVHAGLARVCLAQEEAYLNAARVDDSVQALQRAVNHWQEAIARYPTDPRLRISAGQSWFMWWEESEDPQAARIAVEHFVAALNINDTRLPEEVVRLRPAELQTIYTHLRELQAAGYGPSSAFVPDVPPEP